MQLAVDTDAFCKLGVSGLLDDALAVLGVARDDCGRLPALPYPRLFIRGQSAHAERSAAC